MARLARWLQPQAAIAKYVSHSPAPTTTILPCFDLTDLGTDFLRRQLQQPTHRCPYSRMRGAGVLAAAMPDLLDQPRSVVLRTLIQTALPGFTPLLYIPHPWPAALHSSAPPLSASFPGCP